MLWPLVFQCPLHPASTLRETVSVRTHRPGRLNALRHCPSQGNPVVGGLPVIRARRPGAAVEVVAAAGERNATGGAHLPPAPPPRGDARRGNDGQSKEARHEEPERRCVFGFAPPAGQASYCSKLRAICDIILGTATRVTCGAHLGHTGRPVLISHNRARRLSCLWALQARARDLAEPAMRPRRRASPGRTILDRRRGSSREASRGCRIPSTTHRASWYAP